MLGILMTGIQSSYGIMLSLAYGMHVRSISTTGVVSSDEP